METKRKYELPATSLPTAVPPERALRVSARRERNPGVPLDLDWVRAVRVNRSAVERRAATIPAVFPAGLNPFPQRLEEIRASVEAGAQEIDVVITRAHALAGDWEALYREVKAFREACGDAHLKVILGTGDLATLTNVARASRAAVMAGADFIKTSTGKETVNATLPRRLVVTRQIREYLEETGHAVGFKPARGSRSAKGALGWLILLKEELGDEWL